jgi:hypothetical protein
MFSFRFLLEEGIRKLDPRGSFEAASDPVSKSFLGTLQIMSFVVLKILEMFRKGNDRNQ